MCRSTTASQYLQGADFTVLECRSCGFRFIDTQAVGYPADAQYAYDEPDDFQISPEQPHLRRRVSDIQRYKTCGRALDVGCGKGELAMLLARRGYDCTGIDMKERLIAHLRKNYPSITWRCEITDDLDCDERRFDVITLYHVLEHIPSPVECLRSLKCLAASGALIVLEVPNAGGLEARLRGRRWHYYKVDHVNYFRSADLRRVAEQAGLAVLNIKGYQHFSHPQDVWWKDLVKGGLAQIGFQDVVSVFLKVI